MYGNDGDSIWKAGFQFAPSTRSIPTLGFGATFIDVSAAEGGVAGWWACSACWAWHGAARSLCSSADFWVSSTRTFASSLECEAISLASVRLASANDSDVRAVPSVQPMQFFKIGHKKRHPLHAIMSIMSPFSKRNGSFIRQFVAMALLPNQGSGYGVAMVCSGKLTGSFDVARAHTMSQHLLRPLTRQNVDLYLYMCYGNDERLEAGARAILRRSVAELSELSMAPIVLPEEFTSNTSVVSRGSSPLATRRLARCFADLVRPQLKAHVRFIVRTRPDTWWFPSALPPSATWRTDAVSARARGYVGEATVSGAMLAVRPLECGMHSTECLVSDDQLFIVPRHLADTVFSFDVANRTIAGTLHEVYAPNCPCFDCAEGQWSAFLKAMRVPTALLAARFCLVTATNELRNCAGTDEFDVPYSCSPSARMR